MYFMQSLVNTVASMSGCGIFFVSISDWLGGSESEIEMGKKRLGKQTKKRGVSNAQYMVVYRAVQAGQITWEYAEEQGLVGRVNCPGPKPSRLNEILSKSAKKDTEK